MRMIIAVIVIVPPVVIHATMVRILVEQAVFYALQTARSATQPVSVINVRIMLLRPAMAPALSVLPIVFNANTTNPLRAHIVYSFNAIKVHTSAKTSPASLVLSVNIPSGRAATPSASTAP